MAQASVLISSYTLRHWLQGQAPGWDSQEILRGSQHLGSEQLMIKLALAQKRGEDKFLDSGALELCSFLFVGESWDPRVLIEAGGSTLKRWARPRAEAHLTSCRGWHCGEGPQLISQARRETKSKVSERSATWRVQTHRSRMGTEKKTKGKVVRVEREGQAEELSLGKANVLCP